MLWSRDSRTLIRAAGDKYEAKIWDVTTGQLKATFPVLLSFSRNPFDFGFRDRDQLSIHPTLPIVSAANEKFVRLWSSETGELMQTLENTGSYAAQWSADGTLFLTFAKDLKSASVWDVNLNHEDTKTRSSK
jgi:WD40 repeat protein